mgnify:CR=1 FL=1|tara:strand:- start:2279 stop:2503 length:225 start_codon:yes stop_codon:yes gene_type:complete
MNSDVTYTTETLTVVKTLRIDRDNGAIKLANGQWYYFKDFINDWNSDGLLLPDVGQRVRIEFDKFSNPIDWRSL